MRPGRALAYDFFRSNLRPMSIPAFAADGWLPPGVHDCTLDNMERVFVKEIGSARRSRLFGALSAHAQDPAVRQFAEHIVVDGSFVSRKPEPGDVDLLIGLKPGTLRLIATSPNGSEIQDVLEGWRGRLLGGQRMLDSAAWDVGSTQYDNKLSMLLQSTKTSDPREKGCLRIMLL